VPPDDVVGGGGDEPLLPPHAPGTKSPTAAVEDAAAIVSPENF